MKKIIFSIFLVIHTVAACQLDETENKRTFKLFYSHTKYLNPITSSRQSEHIQFIRERLTELDEEEQIQPNPWTGEKAPMWFPADHQPPSDIVFFEHGGGLVHILKFLNGQSGGYPLEGCPVGRRGIQVSPFIDKLNGSARAGHYASNMLYKFFDYPAVLVGSIERKYLDAQISTYEAGIRTEHFDKIKIVFFQPLALTMRELGCPYYILPILTDFLDNIEKGKIDLPESLLNLYSNNREELVHHWSKVSDSFNEKKEDYKQIQEKIKQQLLNQD